MSRNDSDDVPAWMPFENELATYVYDAVLTTADGDWVMSGIRERIMGTPMQEGGDYAEFLALANDVIAELFEPPQDSWMSAPQEIGVDPVAQLIATETEATIATALQALPESAGSLLTRAVLEGAPLDALADESGRSVQDLQDELSAALNYVADAIGVNAPDGVARSAILGPDGQPLSDSASALREIQLRFAAINEELIARLAAQPNWLYELPPRRFEELVAELYARRGFEVQLTPASKDHGVDVLVARHDELGSSLTVVQCKRHAPDRKVGVSLVREVAGAMSTTPGATAAAMVTTSFFTAPARQLEHDHRFTLSLHDFFVLQRLLNLPAKPRA